MRTIAYHVSTDKASYMLGELKQGRFIDRIRTSFLELENGKIESVVSIRDKKDSTIAEIVNVPVTVDYAEVPGALACKHCRCRNPFHLDTTMTYSHAEEDGGETTVILCGECKQSTTSGDAELYEWAVNRNTFHVSR